VFDLDSGTADAADGNVQHALGNIQTTDDATA